MLLRCSNDIRDIKSLNGKEYKIRKSAYGFGERITFYDKEGNEIESFIPDNDLYTDGIYKMKDHVLVEGRSIINTFSFEEFYKEEE